MELFENKGLFKVIMCKFKSKCSLCLNEQKTKSARVKATDRLTGYELILIILFIQSPYIDS